MRVSKKERRRNNRAVKDQEKLSRMNMMNQDMLEMNQNILEMIHHMIKKGLRKELEIAIQMKNNQSQAPKDKPATENILIQDTMKMIRRIELYFLSLVEQILIL